MGGARGVASRGQPHGGVRWPQPGQGSQDGLVDAGNENQDNYENGAILPSHLSHFSSMITFIYVMIYFLNRTA